MALRYGPATRHWGHSLSAFSYFKQKDLITAAEAAFYLGTLEPEPDLTAETAAVLVEMTPQLTKAGLRLLAGRSSQQLATAQGLSPLKLFTLGKAEVYYRGELRPVRRRSLELLTLLLSRPGGYGAEALSEGLYGSDPRPALRVELHRLRQELNVEIKSRPYRVVTPVWADLNELGKLLEQGRVRDAVALYRGPLLPSSEAPGVTELRGWLEAEVRAAVLATGDVEAVWELAQIMPFDLELWEELSRHLAEGDPRRSVAAGKSARVRLELGV